MAIDPALNVTQAVNAYNQAQQSGQVGNTIPQQDTQAANQGGFGQLVSSYLQQADQIGRVSEQMSIAGMQGQADLAEVATAVSEAELTLQTVVAVRDKVVDAYKEILRMPI